jgi:flavin-dependent dehydrogenase
MAPRFVNAKQTDPLKGFGLPIGSRKRNISGHRFLLVGDAASLIDPFTGEGIGNAIRSGRIAADHIKKCFAANDFSASFNKRYDDEIYNKMWRELKLSRTLQQLLKYPGLFNFVVRKANRNTSLKTMLSHMLSNVDIKQELVNPSFYFKLFFT